MLLYTNFLTITQVCFVVNIYGIIVNCIEIPLSIGWTIRNQNNSIAIKNERLPSGVFSALENANITDSLLNSYNDINLRWIGYDRWTYSLEFDVPEENFNYSSMVLVFHGLDTLATISLNGDLLLPIPNNMFVRYRYDVKDKLSTTQNLLEIQFESPIEAAKQYASQNNFTPPECPPDRYNGECHMNFLRKMQASFAWDWGLAAPSAGIWKPVVLEVYDTAIIRDVTYALDSLRTTWQITVDVYLEAGVSSELARSFEGYLTIDLYNTSMSPIIKHILVSNSNANVFKQTIVFSVAKSDVKLWWPSGYGNQTLYILNITWQGENRDVFTNEIKQTPLEYLSSTKIVNIGFRTVELVEEPLDHGNSFYFKVNDLPIFIKGTNWIPIDILPERTLNTLKIDHLMASVKDAHMNAVRVWGGGIYESDYFYDLADKNGILIWQDMMFACAMYPVYSQFLSSVELEITQNIRRLQRHPSILLWAGNNENEAALVQNWYGTRQEKTRFTDEYVQLYDNVVKRNVLENDQWHIWMFSSPSNGNKIEKIVNENPQDNHYGDIHFYNYVNDGWNSNIFPRARFISEYGFQSIPSMHSIASTMYPADKIDEFIQHRQHFPFGSVPIINLINKHLPLPDSSADNYWDAFTYFSQLSQAMATKIETETYRVGRYGEWKTMGALYWQLNDVWVAPSWSSIEFNGNYKILHHWAKEFFAPIHVVAQLDVLKNLKIYVIRDTVGPSTSLELQMKIYNWANLTSVYEHNWSFIMPENTVQLVHQAPIDDYVNGPVTKQNSFIHLRLQTQADAQIIATNFLLLDKIKNSANIIDPNLKLNIIHSECDLSTFQHIVHLQIEVSAPALFVYIQLKGIRFDAFKLSKNGFIQLIPVDNVTISFSNRNCAMAISNDDLQISTLNDFVLTM